MSEVITNSPKNWRAEFPWPTAEGHKYDRGHTLVIGGPMIKAGAAKLAALAALRTGSGLVSILTAEKDAFVYAASAMSVMTMLRDNFQHALADKHITTIVIGPGAGVNKQTQDDVLAALAAKKNMVIDADAISVFAEKPDILFSAIRSPAILTPHAGEFARLFPALAPKERATAAREAARLSGAVIIYKGPQTIIAAPDGQTCINISAPPDLATAGSGDVLAGICAGLLAQGMPAFKAACAAVWLQGEAAKQHGPGLISEDIIMHLPQSLHKLKALCQS